MATQVLNNVQKLAPADKTFCDLPPVVAEALEQEAPSPPAIRRERFCSPKDSLRAACSSCAAAA
jgi:hypothetical protein